MKDLAARLLAVFLFLPVTALAAADRVEGQAKEEPAEPLRLEDRGMIGGWRILTTDGPNVFVTSPDGKYAMVGRLYSITGQDIGSALTSSGAHPLPAPIAYMLAAAAKGEDGSGCDAGSCGTCGDPSYGTPATEPENARFLPAIPAGILESANPDQATEAPVASETAPPDPAAEPAPTGTALATSALPQDDAKTSLLRELAGAFGFEVGSGGVPVLAIIDAACPFCSRAVHTLRPAIESGRIRLLVRPVGFVSPNSLPLLGGILSAADPAQAFLEFMSAHAVNPGQATSGPVDPAKITQAVRQGVYDNMLLMRRHNIGSVPYFVWTGADGRIQAEAGLTAPLLKESAGTP